MRGSKKPRELPEHWLTATISVVGMAFKSASESEISLSTCPLIATR